MHLPASLVSCKSIYLTPTQTSCRASIRGTICPVSQSTHSHRSTKPQIRFCKSSAQNETGPPTSLFVLFRSGGPRVAWRLTSDEFRSRLNRVRREMSNYDFAQHTPSFTLLRCSSSVSAFVSTDCGWVQYLEATETQPCDSGTGFSRAGDAGIPSYFER